ncbi:Methyltransferase domain-containing protein [Cynara cardunculus var. scolymus]|uniref:Methyltransferase domain-containing protein n=1 Tax=Cynara cardunculus var. scolymus TaxID=59895 RepID=A0A103XHF3_CYNCS|nr:Methyltransferase domain-containing protein [Cynara cardunculus var. scolymus]
MATETLDTPTNGSTSNVTGELNPPEDCANVSHSSPDATPVGDVEQGDKRKRIESETDEKTVAVHPLWKTSLCSYFRRTGGECSHGETCRYAHGEEELRPRPDNTWDPTSEMAKKLKLEHEVREKRSDERDEEVMMTETISEDGCSESTLDKCLVNLPMKWSSDNLRSFLNEQGIQYKSAKTKKGMVVGFVSFETAEQVKTAIEKLQGKPFGNKNLKIADVIPRAFDKIVKPALISDNSDILESANEVEDGDSVNGSSTPGSSVLKGRSAREVVTPLAHMSYAVQLEHKKNSLAQTMKKLTRNARKACPNGVSLPDWILKSREIGGLPCKLEGIIESPLVNGYRNKCEFSVGYSLQGKPTVGFSLGNFREGVTAVEEPLDCPNVSRIGCKYAEIMQNFLQISLLPIWNRMNNTGFWRQLTVREGRTPGKNAEAESGEENISEVLLMVQICSTGFDNEVINVELENMAEAFVVGASTSSPSLPLTVLVVQDHLGISNVAPADAPLRTLPLTKAVSRSVEDSEVVAEARIQDYINNLRFCISPTAFFQVNTLAAEKLYSLAGDWAGLGPNTLLFDVCCGTGTIGLTLAHRVGMVVGIEMNASAVADANRNAEINGIKNCRFVCSKAEDVMGSLLKEYLTKKVDNDADIGNKEETNASEEKAPDAEDSSGLNLKDEKESNCVTESSSSKMHHFENVVAIVDPPLTFHAIPKA